MAPVDARCCFSCFQAAAEVPSYDAQADVAALRLRVKDLESMNARNGVSVFSFRLAGLMTASRSPFAASHLPAEALSAGSALFDACTADISGLCPDVAAQVRLCRLLPVFPLCNSLRKHEEMALPACVHVRRTLQICSCLMFFIATLML